VELIDAAFAIDGYKYLAPAGYQSHRVIQRCLDTGHKISWKDASIVAKGYRQVVLSNMRGRYWNESINIHSWDMVPRQFQDDVEFIIQATK